MKKAAKKKSGQRRATVQWDQDLDKELDKELEGTFPASDPLKIIRAKPARTRGNESPPRRKSR